jgi:GNAT superfamily N-acetyltransferase
MRPRIRKATPEDVQDIIAVLAEASAWLAGRGIVQWPSPFPADVIRRSIEHGTAYVATEGDSVVATITLEWSDPSLWGQRQDAGFVHRVAVRRAHAGLGRSMMEWAERQVIRQGRAYVCLDCLSTNTDLRLYYEELGFTLVNEIPGPESHSHTIAHGPWQAALYERRTDPRSENSY